MNNLTDSEYRDTILTYVTSDMSIKATAEKMYLSRKAVLYRLDRIKEKTGLNPRRFFDLVKLVEMMTLTP